mgnify:CR=1 FL=1
MRRSKDVLLLFFLILAALVIGGIVAELTSGVPALKWLTYGASIGFNHGNPKPLLDLEVLKFSFGFEMKISALQIVLISAALLVYRKVR